MWDWCGTGVTWIRWIHTRWHHYAQAYPFPVGRTSSPLPLPHDSLQGYGEVGSAVGPITASLTVAPSASWRGSSAVHGQKRSRRRRGRRLATSGTMRGSLYQVCGSGRGQCVDQGGVIAAAAPYLPAASLLPVLMCPPFSPRSRACLTPCRRTSARIRPPRSPYRGTPLRWSHTW